MNRKRMGVSKSRYSLQQFQPVTVYCPEYVNVLIGMLTSVENT